MIRSNAVISAGEIYFYTIILLHLILLVLVSGIRSLCWGPGPHKNLRAASSKHICEIVRRF